MNIYKHTGVSLAVSALLFLAFKKAQLSIACFLTGVLLDLDHIFDYYMNQELREKVEYLHRPHKLLGFLTNYYKERKPAFKIYKPLHSLELLIPASILYILGLWNTVATGIVIGFVIHIIMDILPTGNICAMFLIYKIYRGFPQGAHVLKLRMSRAGMDVNKCQSCGATGETIPYKNQSAYIGFTRKALRKLTILCPNCYDRVSGDKD